METPYTSDNTIQLETAYTHDSIDSLLTPIQTTCLSSSSTDDYVQNLSNELNHTKELLKQYQLRTDQLMKLVEKQTNKIADLREQLEAS